MLGCLISYSITNCFAIINRIKIKKNNFLFDIKIEYIYIYLYIAKIEETYINKCNLFILLPMAQLGFEFGEFIYTIPSKKNIKYLFL